MWPARKPCDELPESQSEDSDGGACAGPLPLRPSVRPYPYRGVGDDDSDEASDEAIVEAEGQGGVNDYAGGGRLGIPQAMPSLEEPPQAGLRQGAPPADLDIRRYVRCGDIVNLLGGNKWGHMALLLAVKVYTFRRLLDVAPLQAKGGSEAAPTEARELGHGQDVSVFFLRVLQSASNMADINISTIGVIVHPDTKDLCMIKVVPAGVQLCTGVDGLPIVAETWMSPFGGDTLDLGLLQEATSEARQAGQNNRWSKGTAVRSYLRTAALKPARYATRESKKKLARDLRDSWKARPICSTLPARVWQMYLQRRAAMPRNPLPDMNGADEPMARGTGRGEHRLYCGRGGTVQAQEVADAGSCWSFFCLPSQAGACGPDEGPQCDACLSAQWAEPSDDPDPDIAFVEDVLRIMPVKDDRVLPEDLCRALAATRVWTRVDLHRGLPPHRRAGAPAARRSA